jgi:Flp pilus assembly protein TadG
MFTRVLCEFLRNGRGNIALTYALTLPFLIFGVGFAIDYTRAAALQAELNSDADAAVLAGLTQAMLAKTNADSENAANKLFIGLTSSLSSPVPGSVNGKAVATNPSNNSSERDIVFTYTAQSQTIFAGILGVSSIAVGGSATAKAATAANIDFYVLLDNTASMVLPSTQNGINTFVTDTAGQDGSGVGCAFACHQAGTGSVAGNDTLNNPYWIPPTTSNSDWTLSSSPSGSSSYLVSSGNYATPNAASVGKAFQNAKITKNSNGSYSNSYNSSYPISGGFSANASPSYTVPANAIQMDNYAYARYLGISLRLDEISTAMTTLMTTATNAAASVTPSPTYQIAVDLMAAPYTATFNAIMPLTRYYSSTWPTVSNKVAVMEVYLNNYLCVASGSNPCASGNRNDDVDTNYDNALSSANAQMPDPGNGTNNLNDTPQEVLFIVTDGMEDESVAGARTFLLNGSSVNTNWCTTIKNRQIRIAILYTTYLPITTDPWTTQNVSQYFDDIAPALQACASPGLFYQASVDDNLSDDLKKLFQTTVATAHLTQ